jgi:hypothetical protein
MGAGMRRQIIAAAALLCVAATGSQADIVEQIVSRVGTSACRYSEMMTRLTALQSTGRVSLMNLGKSVQGREIVCAAVHDPGMVFGQGARLMVIARQHGNETSGTEAALALLEHFARSNGSLERDTLRYLTIVVVPMANPDGAERGERRNARGVDLNRDWSSQSQPETQAIARAVKAWQPHAVMDLHELPQSSAKPAYAENFIETIGSGRSIPAALSGRTMGTATEMARWMRTYGYAASFYYDGPEDSRALCHRWFGLQHGIPSFLVEVKTGSGRSLHYRAAIHVLSMLVVANHVMNAVDAPSAATTVAQAPAPASGLRSAARPARKVQPPSVKIAVDVSGADNPEAGVEVEAQVSGGEEDQYVRFYVDGSLRVMSNVAPYTCRLDPASLPAGPHRVRVEVMDDAGNVAAAAERSVMVDESLVAGP